ncbi:glycosyltransferase family 2 protein [Saccharopolyspora sp. CA-218241]|uniref:glycosyltransferase family 2 protein n=1 Tax=Saccharopolyspora sp. CA-218241 TaxID=3240027 RepID=UPI003D98F56F
MSAVARTSVVIATRDRREELLRTLRHLEGLEPRPPVIVVDNASTDGTPDAVAEQHPAVTLVRSDRNLGAVARNVGLLRAITPYVAFSDDDSWWGPGALPRAEEVFDEHPGVGLVAARTLVGDAGAADPVNDLMRSSPLPDGDGLPGPRILGFTACAAVVRRSAFREARGFSKVLFFVAEEKLLAYDLAAHGWDLVYVDDVVAHHHPSPRRGGDGWRLSQEQRNTVLLSWMRRPVGIALRDSARLAGAAVRAGPARRAALGALRRLPSALAHRHRLPAGVEHEVEVLESEHGSPAT